MSHPAIIKASALIHAGDISAAEAALTELVDTEGDNALVEILDELAPKDLLAIIREYDSAKESVINLLVTPRQFAEAVVMERMYAEKNRDRLRAMINSIIFRGEVEPEEFIAALTEKNMGLEVLADYLEDAADCHADVCAERRTGHLQGSWQFFARRRGARPPGRGGRRHAGGPVRGAQRRGEPG